MIEPSLKTLLSLLLVDDHTVVREGLKRLIDPQANQWSITEAGTGFQAIECLRRQTFDLAIVDLSMPGMSGLELTRRIKSEFPSVAVLVLTMHSEEQYAIRALQAGANGYVTKDSAATELVTAVRKVASGGVFLSAQLAERVVQQLNGQSPVPDLQALTNRELDILQRIVSGQRPVDIANALHLSIKTVSTHKKRIQEKLKLDSTAALIRFGLENRLGSDVIDPVVGDN
ncbi:MAG: response regulator transcription factor [Gammaproteobacteria bacterium]|uniref:response regulator n=1 Tax=Hydrogenophaga sp. TaxID=1904254 RepID=UPI0025BC67F2|nr:response regulator transcription factor [Hydrogenophaga sp.]MBU4181555.1 response regulator transcription factor [Gammaproteobacteria bacterium]MBU4282836.1 response regulator transcription factor [Gammaproteobacteria bacterium]MBU4324982.1 response regulator transcription factor [Gammaproteobacteria bacterium]MBU4509334.1 response regulator transcription factor [Gammaproteobacteria bacterium]MCG2655905.1 response regulator transcription factor [Hydrogenophaga sp.]